MENLFTKYRARFERDFRRKDPQEAADIIAEVLMENDVEPIEVDGNDIIAAALAAWAALEVKNHGR